MKKSVKNYRSGKEVADLLRPLYEVCTSHIRQHFMEPDVVFVLAGVQPATKIVLDNPTPELLHELRTLNLLLKKKGIRMRVSTKALRKEINNLQRKATLIIESLDGFKLLHMKLFTNYEGIRIKNFEDIDHWKDVVEKNKDELELVVLNAVEDGEISIENLRLISLDDQEKILNEFLNINKEQNSIFDEDKFFNLLERIHATHHNSSDSFDAKLKDIKIILKNSHHLSEGIGINSVSDATLEILLHMLDSKIGVVRRLAIKILNENIDTIKNRLEFKSKFHMHEVEVRLYQNTLSKLSDIRFKN